MGFDMIFMECHMNLISVRPVGWLEVLDVSGLAFFIWQNGLRPISIMVRWGLGPTRIGGTN